MATRPTETAALTDDQEEVVMMEKLAYSVEDVADLLSVGRSKVVQLVSTGELPSVKLGGRRLVTRRDLDEFVEGLRTASISEAR